MFTDNQTNELEIIFCLNNKQTGSWLIYNRTTKSYEESFQGIIWKLPTNKIKNLMFLPELLHWTSHVNADIAQEFQALWSTRSVRFKDVNGFRESETSCVSFIILSSPENLQLLNRREDPRHTQLFGFLRTFFTDFTRFLSFKIKQLLPPAAILPRCCGITGEKQRRWAETPTRARNRRAEVWESGEQLFLLTKRRLI